MTDENNNANNANNAETTGSTIEHDANEPKIARTSGWSFPKLSLAVGAAMAAIIGIGAVAQSAGGDGEGRGWGMHRMMGEHGMGGKGMGRMMEYRLGAVLEDIGASQEQTDKIKALIETTRSEMEPLRDGMQATRGDLVALLKAPTIDTAAVEKLRADRVAAMDAASKKAVASIVEAANILTPEQRAKLATELENFKGGRK